MSALNTASATISSAPYQSASRRRREWGTLWRSRSGLRLLILKILKHVPALFIARSFFEDVADSANGMDEPGFARSLQLGAQVADIDFQNVGGAFKIQPPD